MAAAPTGRTDEGEGGSSSVSANDQGLVRRLRSTYEVLAREAAKFGIVGAVAFVTDFGVFNLLRYAGPDGVGVLHHKPLTANVISTVISILVAWLGNRYWTFRHRRRASAPRELVLFSVMNGVGLLISLVCLGFTYYVLDLRGPVASNVSAKVVGVGPGDAVPLVGLPPVRLRRGAARGGLGGPPPGAPPAGRQRRRRWTTSAAERLVRAPSEPCTTSRPSSSTSTASASRAEPSGSCARTSCPIVALTAR